MDLYTRCPIRLHGVVLNQLSTGTTLPYTIKYRSCVDEHLNFSRNIYFIFQYKDDLFI
jgi:hypothetical protein